MLTKDIAQALGARLEGDGGIEVARLVHPARAERPSDLAVALGGDAVAALAGTKAVAVIVAASDSPPPGSFKAVIAAEGGRVAFARLTALFDPGPAHAAGVHPTAVVAEDAELGPGVSIGPYSVIGSGSRVGAGTVILSHVTVGGNVAIGVAGLIHAGVRINDRARIGDRAIIHANAVIGSDGFSFAPDMVSPESFTPGLILSRVHSLGNVEIGDDVEIGAGTTIDNATLESTRIGRGCKIDNHVHIGHNVAIGESCIICGMVGISGSVTLGDRVRLAGGVGIGDHLTIGDEAVVAAGSGVGTNVAARTVVSGYPALPHQRSLENFQYLLRQKRLHGKVDDIASRVTALEQSGRNDRG